MKDQDFAKWCVEIVDRLTPHREKYTPFPKYFEAQALNFLVLRSLLPELFSSRYGSALEIGCGVGLHSLLLTAFADRVIGIDIPGEYAGYTPPGFKSSADVARALVNVEMGINTATFADAFPDKIDLPSESVDLVYSWTVLEHIPDLPSAYAEMFRVLKPGGLMLHVVPNVMSAISTMAYVNVDAAKKAMEHPPMGWIGALRHLWDEYRKLAKGYTEKPNIPIPPCHSEFLTDYTDQLNLYVSDSYLFPLLRLGMQLEKLVVVRDFNHALVLRKPTAESR